MSETNDDAGHVESRRAGEGNAQKAVFIPGYGVESTNAIRHLRLYGVSAHQASRESLVTGLSSELLVSTLVVVGADVLSDEVVLPHLCRLASSDEANRMVLVVADEPLDFHSRLRATRMGSVRLFTRGDDYRHLRDLVRKRSRDDRIEGYRVLLVDDSRTDAYLASKYLSDEGLEVEHITDPTRVLDAIHRFNPDVVVSDLHMPDCTGAQMAAVIRQERDATMPIIFLSSESNAGNQLMALASGADGFVTKPLARAPFIAALKNILSRAADRENRMRRDPLTNALNHAQFMATARRMSGSATVCSIAALDIDHFKAVNDTFGHPVGDRVLITLAEMLSDGLRTTDAIGRLGGEEFAILLVGADATQAAEVVNRLRSAFADALFRVEDGNTFGCTFSAGVTQLGNSPADSMVRADEALYESKRAGRNRVTVR